MLIVGKGLCPKLYLAHSRRTRNMCGMREIGGNWVFAVSCPEATSDESSSPMA